MHLRADARVCSARCLARRHFVSASVERVLECVHCGCLFIATNGKRRVCTRTCANRAHKAHRRARERGPVVLVDRGRVFQRDGWICQLCRLPVLRVLVHPHPLSASLDHVVPLSAGGMHVEENCQLAHLRCNLVKGNRTH